MALQAEQVLLLLELLHLEELLLEHELLGCQLLLLRETHPVSYGLRGGASRVRCARGLLGGHPMATPRAERERVLGFQ